MNPENARSYLVSLYPSLKWRKRVKKMSDAQAIAIALKEKERRAAAKKEAKESKDDIPF